jgi:acetolactate synthase-1/2/3 large subunit
VLIAVGTSLHQQVIGWDQELFRKLPCKKIWFEIDEEVIAARKHLVDYSICAPTEIAITLMCNILDSIDLVPSWSAWRARCEELRFKYLLHYPSHDEVDGQMCLYEATTKLSAFAHSFSSAVTDAGIVWYVLAQHYFVPHGASYISSGSFGSMGMALPYAIGAAAATKGRVLALTGDGSIVMCMSELATLRQTQLPVVLVINSNNGYRSIKATQDRYFDGRRLGTDDSTGLFIPNIKAVSSAFELDYYSAHSISELGNVLEEITRLPPKPVLLEIFTYEDQAVEPAIESKLNADGRMSSGGLSDMQPKSSN